MKILRASDHKTMPWKNGGGETTEIAVFPEGAGLADFDWRVSMAKVAGNGPFSVFAGIDRTLAILEGAGITLLVEGDQPVRLTRDSPPHAFPADRPTSADLIDGTVIDFNVMSRRGRIGHTVHRHSTTVTLEAGVEHLILCSKGSVSVTDGDTQKLLHVRDCSLSKQGEKVTVTPDKDSEFFSVSFSRI